MVDKKKTKSAPTAQKMPGESPWPKRIGIIAGVALVVGLVAVVFFTKPELRGVPDGTETQAVGEPVHVEGQIHQDGEVPAGGPHNPIWQNCGFYGEEINSENAVHSLEHGAVWIAYDPTIPAEYIGSLRGFVSRTEKVIVSPVPGQSSPIIATAWGRQLDLDDPGDPRLGQFVNEFTGASTAPEPGGRCNSGVGQPEF